MDTITEMAVTSDVKDKIFYVLSLQPRLTATTLQAALGPFIPPRVWRPAILELITDGHVLTTDHQGVGPGGRWRSTAFYYLTVNKPILDQFFPLDKQ